MWSALDTDWEDARVWGWTVYADRAALPAVGTCLVFLGVGCVRRP